MPKGLHEPGIQATAFESKGSPAWSEAFWKLATSLHRGISGSPGESSYPLPSLSTKDPSWIESSNSLSKNHPLYRQLAQAMQPAGRCSSAKPSCSKGESHSWPHCPRFLLQQRKRGRRGGAPQARLPASGSSQRGSVLTQLLLPPCLLTPVSPENGQDTGFLALSPGRWSHRRHPSFILSLRAQACHSLAGTRLRGG